jgi:hypothetical protein
MDKNRTKLGTRWHASQRVVYNIYPHPLDFLKTVRHACHCVPEKEPYPSFTFGSPLSQPKPPFTKTAPRAPRLAATKKPERRLRADRLRFWAPLAGEYCTLRPVARPPLQGGKTLAWTPED